MCSVGVFSEICLVEAYHPCVNGLIEWFHRQLKAALIVNNDSRTWLENLPLVLLNKRPLHTKRSSQL